MLFRSTDTFTGISDSVSVLFRIHPRYLEGIFAFKMEDVVSELNFDEGIAMPIANIENKQLESEVGFSR